MLRNSGAFMFYIYFHRDLKFGFGTHLGHSAPSKSVVLANSADVLRREGLPWSLSGVCAAQGFRKEAGLAAWDVVWPRNNENAGWISYNPSISHRIGRQTPVIVWNKGFLSRGGRGVQNGPSKEMNGERVSVCTVRCVNPWKVLQLPVCSSQLVAGPIHSPLCPHLLPWDQRWAEVRVLRVGTFGNHHYIIFTQSPRLGRSSFWIFSVPKPIKWCQICWAFLAVLSEIVPN